MDENRAVTADEEPADIEEIDRFVVPVLPGDGRFLHWIVVIFGG